MHLSLFLGPFSRTPADDVPVIDSCFARSWLRAEAATTVAGPTSRHGAPGIGHLHGGSGTIAP